MIPLTNPLAVELLRRIRHLDIRAGVIGLGYVGLPLAVELARAGYSVVGLDIDERKVEAIERGTSYIPDVHDAQLAELVTADRFRATNDFAALERLDTVNICVPTPLRKTKDPDVSYMVAAMYDTSGSFVLRRGVGTQMLTVSRRSRAAKSFVARKRSAVTNSAR